MKIVIDIPEEIYKASQIVDVKYEDVIQIPLEVISNGKPLNPGHWIMENSVLRCSICNEGVMRYDKYLFCPYCGAEMSEDEAVR